MTIGCGHRRGAKTRPPNKPQRPNDAFNKLELWIASSDFLPFIHFGSVRPLFLFKLRKRFEEANKNACAFGFYDHVVQSSVCRTAEISGGKRRLMSLPTSIA